MVNSKNVESRFFGRFTVYLESDPIGFVDGCYIRMFLNVVVIYDDQISEIQEISIINGGFYKDCPVRLIKYAGFNANNDESGVTDLTLTESSGEEELDELFQENKQEIISQLNALIESEWN